jgi:hypothetical protein
MAFVKTTTTEVTDSELSCELTVNEIGGPEPNPATIRPDARPAHYFRGAPVAVQKSKN